MLFINSNHMFADDLENQLSDLCSFTNDITCLKSLRVIDEVLNDVVVIFDDINKPYVSDTRNKLHKLIDELSEKYGNTNYDWEMLLRYLRESLQTGEPCSEAIWCPLERIEKEADDETRRDIERLKSALFNTHVGYNVTGSYNHSKKTITLFTRNLDNTFPSYLSTFCHEFFHAIHHHLIDISSRERTDRYYHTVVLESLATFFQIEYLNHCGFNEYANEIREAIRSNSPVFYPYSGAKDLCNGWATNFCDLLEISCRDFVEALRALILNRYDVELILRMRWNSRVVRVRETIILRRDENSDSITIGNNPNNDVSSANSITPRTFNVYKVKQKLDYIQESTKNYIYGGDSDRVISSIKRGDIIFHEVNNRIVAVSVAKGDGYHSSSEYGQGPGWYLDTEYHVPTNSWTNDCLPQRNYIVKITNPSLAKHIIDGIAANNIFDTYIYLIQQLLK